MNNYLNDLPDEVLEEIVYEYEDQLDEIDVDEIIANLKSNISDYIYDNPDDFIPDFPEDKIDLSYVDDEMIPDEYLERIEPKDICG
ncbi:hypothetical protein [Methanobrevibacter millerae]|uniref:Uncharacterized protein n=1 Tax=Methanobrevibacter millerae TaxID=230361 RepID=A0A1G5XKJ5_9EURY|nr:hypothetical protein [Methanobrevibacter millerae]SDA70999.1 hypothetical protein SAMN02910315_02338 [Methanobrevibacter millerae]